MTVVSDIAIIGLGSVGLRHAGNILSKHCRVIGFDPDSEQRAKLKNKGGIPVESREIALAMASAAVIASPNAAHLEDVRAAVAADCHVLIEKPLAHTDDGVEEILAAAKEKNLTVAIAHNQRFQPMVESAKKIIDNGALGKLQSSQFVCSSYLPDWRPEQDHRQNYTADAKTGGVLFDISHEFDLAYRLLGKAETQSATAENSGTLGIAAEDSANVVLKHDCGARTELHLDYKSKQARRDFKISGTSGQIFVDLLNRRLVHSDVDGNTVDEQVFGGTGAETYEHEMQDFLKAIENKSFPRCDGKEGLDVLRLVLAARRLSGLPAA